MLIGLAPILLGYAKHVNLLVVLSRRKPTEAYFGNSVGPPTTPAVTVMLDDRAAAQRMSKYVVTFAPLLWLAHFTAYCATCRGDMRRVLAPDIDPDVKERLRKISEARVTTAERLRTLTLVRPPRAL